MPTAVDIERWRRHAEECRALAKTFRDMWARDQMLEIAAIYERLAHANDQRVDKPSTSVK